MLSKYKWLIISTLFVTVLCGALFTGWKARGWYNDRLVAQALEEQVEQKVKQDEKDSALLQSSLIEEQNVRIIYRSVRNEASDTMLCRDGGSDFLGLFNRGATAANTPE